MDEKKAGQIAVSGLVFALLGFVMSIAVGVYVMYDKKDDSGDNKTTGLYAPHYQVPHMQYAPPPRAPVHSVPASPVPQTFTPPALAQPGASATQPFHLSTATYHAAPAIPPTVPSGVVGTFFD